MQRPSLLSGVIKFTWRRILMQLRRQRCPLEGVLPCMACFGPFQIACPEVTALADSGYRNAATASRLVLCYVAAGPLEGCHAVCKRRYYTRAGIIKFTIPDRGGRDAAAQENSGLPIGMPRSRPCASVGKSPAKVIGLLPPK